MHLLAHSITRRPDIAGPGAILVDVHVLRIVDVAIGAVLDAIDDLCGVQRGAP